MPMTLLSVKDSVPAQQLLIFIFFLCLGFSVFGVGEMDAAATMNEGKIDPSLLIEIEKLKSEQQPDREIDVLIRTQKEINNLERAAIEKKDGKIGSVIGDILTARIPARAISEIAGLEFIVYIEKSKRQQRR